MYSYIAAILYYLCYVLYMNIIVMSDIEFFFLTKVRYLNSSQLLNSDTNAIGKWN